jgi:rod shape-determining protein MreC
MARRPGSFTSVAQPVRSFWSHFAFALLLAGAFALMLLGKADILLVERFRTGVADVLAPVLEVLSRPAASVADTVAAARRLRDLRAENERLRVDNERLERWQHVARRLEAENKALRALTNFVPEPNVAFITARVIADAGGAFVRSAMINAGAEQGVRRGLAAVSGDGLVGGVVEVGGRHARILLITDLNSQIPVVVERTRDPAVLAGDNTRLPRLVYLPQNAQVLAGDRIVTSGHGGVFPPGLPIGVVTSIDEGAIKVMPYVDWNRLEYIRLLDYGLDGVVKPSGGHPPFSVMGPERSDQGRLLGLGAR